MSGLSDELRNEIARALSDRGADMPCPRCGNTRFVLVNGFLADSVQTTLLGVVIGGEHVRSVAVVCDRCGYLSQHALAVLDVPSLRPERARPAEGKTAK